MGLFSIYTKDAVRTTRTLWIHHPSKWSAPGEYKHSCALLLPSTEGIRAWTGRKNNKNILIELFKDWFSRKEEDRFTITAQVRVSWNVEDEIKELKKRMGTNKTELSFYKRIDELVKISKNSNRINNNCMALLIRLKKSRRRQEKSQ